MGGEITNQSGKGDKRIFQTLKEKSLDLPKEESLGREYPKVCVNLQTDVR